MYNSGQLWSRRQQRLETKRTQRQAIQVTRFTNSSSNSHPRTKHVRKKRQTRRQKSNMRAKKPMSKIFAVDCLTCGSATHIKRNYFWVINMDHTNVIEVCSFNIPWVINMDHTNVIEVCSFNIPKCLNVDLQLNCKAQKSHCL